MAPKFDEITFVIFLTLLNKKGDDLVNFLWPSQKTSTFIDWRHSG